MNNIKSFDDLLKEVDSYHHSPDSKELERWKSEFEKLWATKNEIEENWTKLMQLLPVGNSANTGIEALSDYLNDNDAKLNNSTFIFLSVIAMSKLLSRYLPNPLSDNSVRFVCGCLNIWKRILKSKSKHIKSILKECQSYLSEAMKYYPATLIAAKLHKTEFLVKKDDKLIVNQIAIIDSKFLQIQITENSLDCVCELLEKFKPEEMLKFYSEVSGSYSWCFHLLNYAIENDRNFPYKWFLSWLIDHSLDREEAKKFISHLACQVIKTRPKDLTSKECVSILEYDPFEDCRVSKAFSEWSIDFNNKNINENLRFIKLWSPYLHPDQSFEFIWFFYRSGKESWENKKSGIFGENLDASISILKSILFAQFFKRQFRELNEDSHQLWRSREEWLQAIVDLFRTLASLIELNKKARSQHPDIEESFARQAEARRILTEHPTLISSFIHGSLTLAQEYWELFDPIILGIPKEEVIKCLEEQNKDHNNQYFHAQRLISHLKGQFPGSYNISSKNDLLGAVETFIATSNSSIRRDYGQTWLGDSSIERFICGGIRAAQEEFNRSFDRSWNLNEHRHVHYLAERMAEQLNRINSAIQEWLKGKNRIPASLTASVRELPERSRENLPQEGGEKGLKADLAILISCSVPELVLSSRATLIQAKKANRNDSGYWSQFISINDDQLNGLIDITPFGHFVFFFHSELGESPLFIPAQTIQDYRKAYSSPKIAVETCLRSGKGLMDFMLHDMIGLWSGDTNRELINSLEEGKEFDLGPIILLDIRISRGIENL